MASSSEGVILSNLDVFLSIARESNSECQRLFEAHRRPKPDGSPGQVITSDPERRSFKHGLIAIAFSGIYLDSLLRIVMIRHLGVARAQELERRQYEVKLSELGITDQDLLLRTRRFRDCRNDVMHEEPIVEGVPLKRPPETAQESAKLAVDLMEEITEALRKSVTQRP